MSHIPHEVVTQILLLLPVTSLLRFRCVCKAWRDTISDDPSFRRDLRLHRHKRPCLLIIPQIQSIRYHKRGHAVDVVTTAGLYRWEETHHHHRAAATLLHPMDSEVACAFAHCEGLVMVVTASAVRVLNPATRDGDVLTLPWTATFRWFHRHMAFGLGRDPRTDAYKIVRIVSGSVVEIFTIGADQQQWRRLVAQPPHGVVGRQIATFFQGSLLWIISQHDPASLNGFLRLRLDDETFSVMPLPHGLSWSNKDELPMLAELRGELCVACPPQDAVRTLDMYCWVSADMMDSAAANLPRWDKRYTIHWDWPCVTSLRPVAVLDDVLLVCQASGNRLFRCILKTQKTIEVKDKFHMEGLEYYNLEEDVAMEYPHENKTHFDVIPYIPSSVAI